MGGEQAYAQQQGQPGQPTTQGSLSQVTEAVDERDGRAGRESARRKAAQNNAATPDRRVQIIPRLETRLSWTDNASGLQKKGADWLGEISPGINISSDRGRFTGLFDATWRSVGYGRHSELSESFAEVQGSGSLEAVDDLLFIDLDANVNRRDHSLLSSRSSNNSLNTNKDDELRGWAIGPRLKFRLGAAADATLQYRSSWFDHKELVYGKQHDQLWAAQLGKPTAARYIGWNLEYTHNKTDYESNQEVIRKLGRATIFLNMTPRFRVRLTGGHESNDYGGGDKSDDGGFWGAGFDWNPTERTTVSLLSEDRVFGNGYNFRLSHRTRHALFEINGVRDITSSSKTLVGGVYQDPAFRSVYNNPALAIYTDPIERARIARSILYPGSGGSEEFVTNDYYLDETWRAGVTLAGKRDTISLFGQRSRRKRVAVAGLTGFSNYTSLDIIDTRSATLAYDHQLTPLSSFSAVVTRTDAKGYGYSDVDSRSTSASLGLRTKLGLQTHAGLTYFYQRTDSDNVSAGGDYTENSLTANLGMSF
jgi:uncharacterized protein (PEP-CTERM system associated)